MYSSKCKLHKPYEFSIQVSCYLSNASMFLMMRTALRNPSHFPITSLISMLMFLSSMVSMFAKSLWQRMFSNVPARLSWGTLRMGPGDSASAGLVAESSNFNYWIYILMNQMEGMSGLSGGEVPSSRTASRGNLSHAVVYRSRLHAVCR